MIRSLLATLALALTCMAALAMTPEEADRIAKELKWLQPGQTGSLAGKAEFKASDAYTFLAQQDTDKFLQLNGNPPHGNSVTIAPIKGDWFGVLSFADEGYIKDDEKIDADALLKSLKDSNAQHNEEKRKQGYQALVLEGWAIAPRYDAASKRLEWGTLLRTDDGKTVANISTRILGRSGYTAATLVTSVATMEADLADFKTALKDFDYVSGEKYSEWREGDKVAAYGLGALVVGGAAAAVASKGGFKLIGALILGGLAALGGLYKKFTGRRKASDPA